MESLHGKLENIHRKRVSDSVWAAADAAHFVLSQFRAQVQNNTLVVSDGLVPQFVFNPYALTVPAESTFKVANWESNAEYVLDTIRSSTGMAATWGGAGTPIHLSLKSSCGRASGSEKASRSQLHVFIVQGSCSADKADGGAGGCGQGCAPPLPAPPVAVPMANPKTVLAAQTALRADNVRTDDVSGAPGGSTTPVAESPKGAADVPVADTAGVVSAQNAIPVAVATADGSKQVTDANAQ